MIKKDVTQDLEFVKKVVIDNIPFSHIASSNIHGFGLFAEEAIKKGSIVGLLDGQVMNWDKYDDLKAYLKDSFSSYQNYIFMEWNALDKKTLLVRPFRTKYSFINHSYKPNLKVVANPLRLVCLRDINVGEEFLLDYTDEPLREEYLKGHGETYL